MVEDIVFVENMAAYSEGNFNNLFPNYTAVSERESLKGGFGKFKLQRNEAVEVVFGKIIPGANGGKIFSSNENLKMNRVPGQGTRVADQPGGLQRDLMRHQLEALYWLKWREAHGLPKGGIYADDIGVGKTAPMIALILSTKAQQREEGVPGTLVVCEIDQWVEELGKVCGANQLNVCIYHGPNRRHISKEELTRADVVLTSYGVVRIDSEEDAKIRNIKWSRIILDNAHTIRNCDTDVHEAVTKLNSAIRWCVTGTPVHNRMEDIRGLLMFLRSSFDCAEMWGTWLGSESANARNVLSEIIKSLVFRRTKKKLMEEDKVDLPNLEITTVKVYYEEKDDEAANELEETEAYRIFHNDYFSSKVNKAVGLLSKVAEGDKVVIVSKWEYMLQLIKTKLDSLNISYVTLDGSVAVGNRMGIVNDFNTDCNIRVMLLTFSMGSRGFNLIGGNHIFLVDPHSDPQLERQVVGGLHRIGQKKKVHVYRLVTGGTNEERIYLSQYVKKYLVDDILAGDVAYDDAEGHDEFICVYETEY